MNLRPAALAALLVFPVFVSSPATATDPPRRPLATSAPTVLHGGSPRQAKADSVVLMGGVGSFVGRFQTFLGQPHWQGWTPVDNTALSDNHWQVSGYGCANLEPDVPDNRAWWCGDTFANACAEGYGHQWDDVLVWSGTHEWIAAGGIVRVKAVANLDILDVGYDVLALQALTASGWTTIASFDGSADSLAITEEFTLAPEDLVGPDRDELHLRWRFTSDSIYDDEDCVLDSDGPVMLDRIEVWLYAYALPAWYQIGVTEDLQDGTPVQWSPGTYPGAVGNFGHLAADPGDLDPCSVNASPQAVFVDDGAVVPGTGGYRCITWCYGPDGWVVNPEGGLAGPDHLLDAMVVSPVFDWPGATYDGALLEFDVYPHLLFEAGATGIFWDWKVRTAAAGEDIGLQAWRQDPFVRYGGTFYERQTIDLSDWIEPDCARIQVALGVEEMGWPWGMIGVDATPAPYFDNVRLTAFEHPGPRLSIKPRDLAQDGFPPAGILDLDDLGANSVRFDAAVNTAIFGEDPYIDPGDSLSIKAVAKHGAPLDAAPWLHYRLFPNPLFDPYRTAVPPGEGNTSFAGKVVCLAAPPPNDDGETFFADLPDTGFFFPGDVVHYFFRSVDMAQNTALLPADTTGFSALPVGEVGLADFYDPRFTVRALPTVFDGEGDQPAILLWDDSGSDAEFDAWLRGLSGLSLELGTDYDLYVTQAPWYRLGNGLGGRTGSLMLRGYDTILYTSGQQTEYTLTASDPDGDLGDNLALLESWLFEPDRTLVVMGDDLVAAMTDDYDNTAYYLQNVLGVSLVGRDARPEIDMQAAPTVWPVPGDPIFDDEGWLADGDCPAWKTFDAIVPDGAGYVSAEFLTPGGAPGTYGVAAAVTTPFHYAPANSETIVLPYGLRAVDEIAGLPGDKGYFPAGPLSFLYDILAHAGHPVSSSPPPAPALALSAHPNPFNPRTEIHYSVAAAGPVTLDLFDLRGRLVRRLIDEVRPAGGSVAVWDGRDDGGHEVSSGVYFCILEAEGGRGALKVTLLR